MAFSSSAISYLLGEGVSKPVIFTGSQIPLSKTRNDAQRNLITSITIAATQTDINEVALYFDNKLIRGNRAVKVSASAFHAFESPNYPPLGSVGIEINLDKPMLLAPPPADKSLDHKLNLLKLQRSLAGLEGVDKNFSVISIMLYPGIVASTIKSILEGTKPPVKGVILQAFGAGNAPANTEMIQTLKDAHDKNGVVLCDITQIVSGGE
jgi:L-asparaginase